MKLGTISGEPDPVKVLLVDDRPEDLLAMKAILDRSGYEVVTASSGEEALMCLLRDTFVVILLDVAMPRLDGFETATLIRERASSQSIPIIFVSSAIHDVEQIFQACFSAGAVDFLPKPIDPQALRRKVAVFAHLFRQSRELERRAVALREAERKEREFAEAMYQITFEEAPIGIGHVAFDGTWLRVNQRLSELVGRRREELPLLKLEDLVHPDDRAALGDAIKNILAGGEAIRRQQCRFIRPDGSVLWMVVTISPLLDSRGAPVQLTIVEDISEQKRLEESLEASEARFAHLQQSALFGVVFEDPDGTLTGANDTFLSMIGYSHDDLRAGRIHLRDLTPSDYDEVDRRAREELRAQGFSATHEKAYLRKDGRLVYVLVGAAAHGPPERGVTGFALDITDRKQVERERAEILRELRQSVQARDDFLSISAHELKNPLTPIVLMVTSLLAHARKTSEPMTPEWLVRHLEPVERGILRLERLTDGLLDVSRLTLGRLELGAKDVDLSEVARAVVDGMRPEIERARCPLSLRLADQVIGRWDRGRLEQALSNLVANSLKYGAGKPIEIEIEGDEKVARVSVRDHGIGIAAGDQARLFTRFERLVPVQNYGGFGLGLWIARRIVEGHGGKIWLSSAPGEGSLFTIELPRAPGRRRAEGDEGL
jgi:PAS domain S-box-containing protein